MSNELSKLIASKFIARKDVKARQYGEKGIWSVHTVTGKADDERIPWRQRDLLAHLEGTATYGHYLLNEESTSKLFAFDIDFEQAGFLPEGDYFGEHEVSFYEEADLRGAWLNRKHPARAFMKYELKVLTNKLMATAWKTTRNAPLAAAYSGSKGIHVYVFTGLGTQLESRQQRKGAEYVLEEAGFELSRGKNFFKHPDYGNFSVEIYPKQDYLDGSKSLGNLMRLPLGKNLKAPKEPTFFIDMTSPIAELVPLDPIKALTQKDPWQ